MGTIGWEASINASTIYTGIATLLRHRRALFAARLRSLDPDHPLVSRLSGPPIPHAVPPSAASRPGWNSIKRSVRERRTRSSIVLTRLPRTSQIARECPRPVLLSRQYIAGVEPQDSWLPKPVAAARFSLWPEAAPITDIVVYSDGSLQGELVSIQDWNRLCLESPLAIPRRKVDEVVLKRCY